MAEDTLTASQAIPSIRAADDLSEAVRAHRRRLAIGVVSVYALMLFGGTHLPKVLIPRLPTFFSFDKVCHFTGYAILTLLLLLMPVGFFRRVEGGYRSPAWFAAILVVLLVGAAAMLDEVTQPLVQRDFDLVDWACDVAGALSAMTIVTLGLAWQFVGDRLSTSHHVRPRTL